VTGVCRTSNLEMVRSIGADRAIDYTREDFTKGAQHYDIIFDCFATHSLSSCRRALTPKGIYVGVGGAAGPWMIGLILVRPITALAVSPFVSQKFTSVHAKPNKGDLTIIGELMAAGRVTPVIDRRYTLVEVPEAIRYLEEGHARGKVVINLQN